MTKENLYELVHSYKKLISVTEKAQKIGAINPDGELYYALFLAFDAALDCLDELEADWIRWFIYDNHCGKGKLQASAGELKKKEIKTVGQLWQLIQEEKKENSK